MQPFEAENVPGKLEPRHVLHAVAMRDDRFERAGSHGIDAPEIAAGVKKRLALPDNPRRTDDSIELFDVRPFKTLCNSVLTLRAGFGWLPDSRA